MIRSDFGASIRKNGLALWIRGCLIRFNCELLFPRVTLWWFANVRSPCDKLSPLFGRCSRAVNYAKCVDLLSSIGVSISGKICIRKLLDRSKAQQTSSWKFNCVFDCATPVACSALQWIEIYRCAVLAGKQRWFGDYKFHRPVVVVSVVWMNFIHVVNQHCSW